MNVNEYTARVREQLLAAAALGDERTQQVAQALSTTAESAVRLAILDAVAATAGEVTAALFEASGGDASPGVSAGLVGDEIRISVSHPPLSAEPSEAPDPGRTDEGEATARISLRLSEALKAQIEAAAVQAEVSVNAWLVRMASAAVSSAGNRSGWPGAAGGGWPGANWGGANWGSPGSAGNAGGRITGWVTG